MSKTWLTILSIMLIMLTVPGCGTRGKAPFVSLEHDGYQDEAPAKEEEPLRVAIASITSARESIIYYDALLRFLEQYLQRPIHLVQRKTYAEVNDLIRAGAVDLGFICTYSYVLGEQDFGMELLVAPVINGEMTYNSYIIVHRDSGIATFKELRNRSFAFTDPISNSGRLYPLYVLYNMGETPESFFGSHIFTYSHDNSVRAVAERLVDGAAVDSLVFYYMADREPEAFENLLIIHKSPPFGIQPVVVRPGLDPLLKETLRDFFLTLHEDEHGRQLLSDLKFDRFMPQDKSAYDSIRDMAESIMR